MNIVKKTAARLIEGLLEEKAQEDLANVSPWPALAVMVLPLLAAAVPAVVDHVQRKNRRERDKDARLERLEDLLGPQLEEIEKERQEKKEYNEARELLANIETAKWVITRYEEKREKKEKSAA